jgi:hypothetical protein
MSSSLDGGGICGRSVLAIDDAATPKIMGVRKGDLPEDLTIRTEICHFFSFLGFDAIIAPPLVESFRGHHESCVTPCFDSLFFRKDMRQRPLRQVFELKKKPTPTLVFSQ